jgi:ribosomal protein S8
MQILSSFFGILKSCCLTKTKSFIAPCNKKVLRVCDTLYDLGYIYGFTLLTPSKVRIQLKFANNKSVIRSLNLVSKSSLRIFLKKKNLKGRNILTHIHTFSFLLLSTSLDTRLLTDIECFMLNIGGEPVAIIS